MIKTTLSTLGKLTLAALLIAWLMHSGQLDFTQLKLFAQDPWLTVAVLIYYGVGIVFLSTWRWKTLLEGAGYTLSRSRAFTLQMTGLFFSTVMPGAVGGDLIKIAYVIRDNPGKGKTLAAMTALLDRIVGLASLFMVCWVMILFNISTVRSLTGFWPIIVFLTGSSAAFLLFFAAALHHYKGTDPFLKILNWKIPGFGLIEKLYSSLRMFRYAREAIVKSLVLSMIIQAISLCVFYFITCDILGEAPNFGKIAVVFPIGVTTTAIPLTPGGLGVGHVAFDRLFQMVGLEHGANVFNLFVLSQLFLNLFGVIPYLTLKKIPLKTFTEDDPLEPSHLTNPS